MRTQFFFTLLLLLLLTALASASPLPSSTGVLVPSATLTPPASYYLVSRGVGGEGKEIDGGMEGLYVGCWNIGNL